MGAFILLAAHLAACVLSVAPEGDDGNPGTADRPLATPFGAQARLQSLSGSGGSRDPVAVEFADGVWSLDRPLKLMGLADSGKPGRPVVWRARHPGRVVWRGGVTPAWREANGAKVPVRVPEKARRHLLTAVLPGTDALPGFTGAALAHVHAERREHPPSLYQDGVRLTCARWPDDRMDVALSPTVVEPASWRGEVTSRSGRVAEWAREPDLWAFGCWRRLYAEFSTRVVGVDVDRGVLEVDLPFHNPGLSTEAPHYVFNALCELDRPGEWVVDRANRRFWVWPIAGKSLPVVARLPSLIVAASVSDVTFEGFVFEQTTERTLVLGNCERVDFVGCTVRQTSGGAAEVKNGSACAFRNCVFTDLGEGGVRLSGGSLETLTPAGHAVENCRFVDYGRLIHNYRPAVFLGGVGCRAVGNRIGDSDGQAIVFEGNDHCVVSNDICRVCRWNNDVGAIYGYMENWFQRGTEIAYNVIRDIGRQSATNAIVDAIYLDCFTSGVRVHHNVIVRSRHCGIFSSGGNGNSITDNVIVETPCPLARWNLGLQGKRRTPFGLAERGKESPRYRTFVRRSELFRNALWRSRYPLLQKVLDDPDAVHAHNAIYTTFRDNVLIGCGESSFIDLDVTEGYHVVANNRRLAKDAVASGTEGLALLNVLRPVVSPSSADNVAWMLQTNLLERAECRTDAALPNVLILGDSISMGYTPFVKRRLSGVANVTRPACNCAATQFYLREKGGMKDWVGTNRWDVITVNCGCWDICYMKGDPLGTDHYWGADAELKKLPPLQRGTAIRDRGFHVRTPILQYMANLRTILTYLKSTGATVIFPLSVPCPAYQYDDRCGLFRAYNEVAAAVCRELGVRTVDLYAVGERNYDKQPDGAHYNDAGNDLLAAAVASEIAAALKKRGR